jgi:hypothetical protein
VKKQRGRTLARKIVTFATQAGLGNKQTTWCTLHFHYTLLRFKFSTCFGHYLPIFRRHYMNAGLVTIVCSCKCGLISGCGKWSVHQVGCVYYVITSLWCTVNNTLHTYKQVFFHIFCQRKSCENPPWGTGYISLYKGTQIATYAALTSFMSEFHITTEQPQSSGHVAGLYSSNVQLQPWSTYRIFFGYCGFCSPPGKWWDINLNLVNTANSTYSKTHYSIKNLLLEIF